MVLLREKETVGDREERIRKRSYQQFCDLDTLSVGSETSDSGGFDSADLNDDEEDDDDEDDDDEDDDDEDDDDEDDNDESSDEGYDTAH